jgi:hypothetical protein
MNLLNLIHRTLSGKTQGHDSPIWGSVACQDPTIDHPPGTGPIRSPTGLAGADLGAVRAGELLGGGQVRVEGAQVAVVDADHLHPIEAQHPLHLFGVVHLHQGSQAQAAGHLEEVGQILII